VVVTQSASQLGPFRLEAVYLFLGLQAPDSSSTAESHPNEETTAVGLLLEMGSPVHHNDYFSRDVGQC
jgi:hypothetical protein